MPRNAAAYDTDFFAWTEEQVRLLRAGELSQLDIENLAEEVEDMGRRLRQELRNRLAVLAMHLLKWQYRPGHRSRSWGGTIREQRAEIAELLEESPSLGPTLARALTKAYSRAAARVIAETGLPETTFPAECPFTPEQILDETFLLE